MTNPIKLKWKNADAPTGRFRSFHKRGWPSATIKDSDDLMVAMISCEDAFSAAAVKEKRHGELKVSIADWRRPTDPDAGRWVWRTLKTRFADLVAAKAAAKHFIDSHPEYFTDLER